MRVVVTGSRVWDDEDAIYEALKPLAAKGRLTIVHGGARGADTLTAKVVRGLGATQEVYRPDWGKYGKAAGIVRNAAMLDTKPDLVLAFWDGASRGTKYTIDEARRRGIPVRVIQR